MTVSFATRLAYRKCRCRKAVLQCETSGIGLDVGGGGREWRLERKLLCNVLIRRRVVVDPVPRANDRLLPRLPRNPDPGSKVGAIRMHQGGRVYPMIGTACTRQHELHGVRRVNRRLREKGRRHVEACNVTVQLFEG